MKKFHHALLLPFITLMLFIGCKKDEVNSDWTNKMEDLQAHNAGKVSIQNGIAGTISRITGNCMPSIGEDSDCVEVPVERTIWIYAYTLQNQASRDQDGYYSDIQTDLIETAQSDDEGFYEIALPAGTYSVFIEEDGKPYANGLDGQGGINPVEVPTQGVVTINHRIDRAVW